MQELEKDVLTHLQERHWDELRPGDLAKSISIEAAELLELFQWDNPELSAVRADAERLAKIKKELADVLIYCLDASVLLGFNTETIIRDKLAKVVEKYPADLFRDRPAGVEPGTEEAYWHIKKEHRAHDHD